MFLNILFNLDENDLRKSIFVKLNQLFSNLILDIIRTVDDEAIEKISNISVNGEKIPIQGISAKHLVNSFASGLRTCKSEIIELIEHLLNSILEATSVKKENKYTPFFKLLFKTPFLEEILDLEDRNYLMEWVNKYRNPRHRNYFDYHNNSPVTFDFSTLLVGFGKLLEITQKIVNHPKVKSLSKLEDKITTRTAPAANKTI